MRVMLLELAHHHHSKVIYVIAAIFALAMSLPLFWLDAFTNVFLNHQASMQVYFSLLPWFVTVFVPAIAMRSWVAERRNGTLELLQTFPIHNHALVVGKFAAHLVVIALCLLASFPLAILIAQLGDLDWGPVLGGYLGALFLASVSIALCQTVTFYSKSQAAAYMLGVVTLALFTFGLPQGWNLHDRFAPLARGLLDTQILVQLTVFTLIALYLNSLALRYQRSGASLWRKHLGRDLIFAAILAILLLGATLLPWRKDLTADRLFTLNQASIRLVQKLEQPVELRFYLSSDMPAKLRPVAKYMTALAEEYDYHGGDQLLVRYIDPDDSLELLAATEKLEIMPTKVNITERGRQEVVNLWFACAVLSGNQKEVFKTMPAVADFEYEISAAIMRLTNKRKQKVMLAGPLLRYGKNQSYQFDINANMAGLANALGQVYEVEQQHLDADTTIAWDGADILIAWGLERWQDAQLEALDAWLAAGKPALLMVDGVEVDPLEFVVNAYPENAADDYYAHLGFQVERQLVADFSCMKVRYKQSNPPVLEDYYLFPVLLPQNEGFDAETFGALQELNKLTLAYASPLNLRQNAPHSPKVIAQSSPQSWPHEPESSIHPEYVPGPTFFERYTLGLYYDGPYQSKWATPAGENKNKTTRFAVFAGSHTLVQSGGVGSRAFFTNVVSYLTRDQALAGINRQETAFRTIAVPTDHRMQQFKWSSLILPLAIVFLAWLATTLGKRMRRYAV